MLYEYYNMLYEYYNMLYEYYNMLYEYYNMLYEYMCITTHYINTRAYLHLAHISRQQRTSSPRQMLEC